MKTYPQEFFRHADACIQLQASEMPRWLHVGPPWLL
jgi:hypothetical protein